jgi:hypothetical protein
MLVLPNSSPAVSFYIDDGLRVLSRTEPAHALLESV